MGGFVGALAIFLTEAASLIGAFLLLNSNRDQKNRTIMKAVATGNSSTHTAVGGRHKPDHMS